MPSRARWSAVPASGVVDPAGRPGTSVPGCVWSARRGYRRWVPQPLVGTDHALATALLATPRASWRELARRLGISERTVVRRVPPLFDRGVLRATAVRNPAYFPDLIAMALRIRSTRDRIHSLATALARRPDVFGVGLLGGGSEIGALLFLDGIAARDALLRELPDTLAVTSWDERRIIRIFPAAHDIWPGPHEPRLGIGLEDPLDPPEPLPIDRPLIDALIRDGRATYTDLSRAAGITVHAARRRLDTLLRSRVVRPITVVDPTLLGLTSQALLWLSAPPTSLEHIGRRLGTHPRVFFAATMTGPANLLIGVAARDPDELSDFRTGGALHEVTTVETAEILSPPKPLLDSAC
ncbi:Lrp/AsnC family transcriptional regulator [Nocardia terpenica]|uniref:Lrp/AsnC family transcriptional regulator n=1 Tax=Nocardia terpenica TaxID=455432 RepID=UPI002FE13282